MAYQSQGQAQTIDLQYSSGQADPQPVVQYQFTIPVTDNVNALYQIKAEVDLGGVVQGTAVTYTIPSGLSPGDTFNIPMQVDASSLATGVYSYTIKISEFFGNGESNPIVDTTSERGVADVVNESNDAMGAGWSVGGLQQRVQPVWLQLPYKIAHPRNSFTHLDAIE